MTTQRNPWHPDYKPRTGATTTVGRRKKEVATAPVHTSAAVDEDLTGGATVTDEAKDIVGQTDGGKNAEVPVGAGLSGDPNANNLPSTEVPQGAEPAPAEVISESVTEVDDSLTPEEPVGGTSGNPNAHNPTPDDVVHDGDTVTLKEAVEPVDGETVEEATGEAPQESTEPAEGEAPWHTARRHDDVDAAVPVGTDLPEGWKDFTLAEKRDWLDENVA